MSEKKTDKNVPFEQLLEKLETIVAQLESGDLGLEESMKKFEDGMKLAAACRDRLGKTEKKIEMLVRKSGADTPEWKPVTDDDDDAETDPELPLR